jgi:hypothetical protein
MIGDWEAPWTPFGAGGSQAALILGDMIHERQNPRGTWCCAESGVDPFWLESPLTYETFSGGSTSLEISLPQYIWIKKI